MKDVKAYGTIGWEEKIKDDLARLQQEYPEITYDQVKSIVKEQFGKKFDDNRSYPKSEDAFNFMPEATLQASKRIASKWLCQALDRNDSKSVRKACIVLKAMEQPNISEEAIGEAMRILTEEMGLSEEDAKSRLKSEIDAYTSEYERPQEFDSVSTGNNTVFKKELIDEEIF